MLVIAYVDLSNIEIPPEFAARAKASGAKPVNLVMAPFFLLVRLSMVWVRQTFN